MSNRGERLRQNLGLTEYPWSSDDDDDNLGVFQQSSGASAPNPAPDISVVPSSQPSTASTSNAALPSSSGLGSGYGPSMFRQQRSQVSLAERQLFWSMMCNNRPTVDHTNSSRGGDGVRRSPQPVITSARPRRASPLREARGVLAVRRNVRPPHRSAWSNGPPLQALRGGGRVGYRSYRSTPALFTPAPAPPPSSPAVARVAAGVAAGASPEAVLRMVVRARDLQRDYQQRTRECTSGTLEALRPRPAHAPAPPPPPPPPPAPAPAPVADDVEWDLIMDSDDVDADATMPPADTSGGSGSVEMQLEEEVLAPTEAPEPPQEPQGSAQADDAASAEPATRPDLGEEAHSTNVKSDSELNQSLLRLLECPVCLEWMEPPMCQCRRGHLVCVACRARLTSCPVCRTAFSSVRNRAMEGVAETLRYPCRHGCGTSTRLRRRATHEASCARRRVACPAPACARRQPQPMHEMQRHVQAKHPEMLKTGRAHNFQVRVNAEAHDNYLVAAIEEIFHVRIDVSVRTWGISVYVAYMGPKINARKYEYQVTIEGKDNARKVVYTRSTHSDLESASVNITRQDCFYLSMDQALNFMRLKSAQSEPENLNVHVEISERASDECGEEERAGESDHS